MQTPLTANATRERHPTRSAHDTGFIRASRALSHHERSQMPPAPPQSLKMLYSEPGEACGHVRASESTPPHRRKAPHQAHNRRAQRGHNSVHEAHTREGGSKQPPPSRQRRSRYLPVSYRTATQRLPVGDVNIPPCIKSPPGGIFRLAVSSHAALPYP